MLKTSWLVLLGLMVAAAGCKESDSGNDGLSSSAGSGSGGDGVGGNGVPGGSSSGGDGAGGTAGVAACDDRVTTETASADTEWSSGLTVGPNGPIPFIVVDQFGYRTSATKVAVIRNPQQGYDSSESFSPGNEYAVVDSATGSTVFTGAPTAWNGGATDEVSGDAVWWFDFSSVTTPGTYTVVDVANDQRSVEFVIDDEVYRSVLKYAVKSFYYQRAGQEKSAEHAGADWADSASHTQDAQTRSWLDQDNADTARDLSGGWYDAGDYNKYTAWTASYVIRLLRAYERNPTAFTDDYGIPESGNCVPDILDEVKWGIEWLVRMQLEDGSLLCVQGLASASPPSAATDPSYYGPPTTNASLTTAAAFAYASKVYGARPEAEFQSFAADLLTRAQSAYSWADANPDVTYYNNDEGQQPGSGGLAAGQQEVGDEARLRSKVEAAIYLFEQTGNGDYQQFVDANYASIIPNWGPDQWMADQQDALLYYSSLSTATPDAATAIRDHFRTNEIESAGQFAAVAAQTDPYRAHMQDYVWGSNRSKAAQGALYQFIDDYDIDDTVAPQAVDAAEEFIHYFHGVNPLGLVYLSNMNHVGAEHSVSTFYHSWFSHGSPQWDEVTATTPGPAPGFLVGGPNPSHSVDGCCSGSCSSQEYCSMEWEPPLNQPAAKSYLQFNESWPANSWAVTENSDGYQSWYIQLLARYAR